MPESVRIFVSSTWEDLEPERQAVEAAIHRMADTDFEGMEYFGSRPETSRKASLEEVDRSAIYVGIFAHRYGSGITEDEYRRALERNLPCLIYLKDESVPVPPKFVETDPAKIKKRDALREELRRVHTSSTFTSPDNLAAKVIADLHNRLGSPPVDVPAPASRRFQLPADLADFTGRGDEADELVAHLSQAGGHAAISAIGGLGGIGKTVLAVHVAHRLKDAFRDAQIVVNMAGTSDKPISPAQAMALVINAFEPEARVPDDAEQVAHLYRSVLNGQRALIILDNARDAAQVEPLTPAPPAALIVTSQNRIIVPGVELLGLDALPVDEARELLRTVCRRDDVNDDQLDQIAELCARLPLALRAAGTFLAASPTWNADDYNKALTDQRQRLKRLKQGAIDVEAVLGVSAAHLIRANRELAERWQMLTVFPATFDLPAAAAVLDCDEIRTRDDLTILEQRSLILFDSDTQRYRFHDLMRLVAEEPFSHADAEPKSTDDDARLHQAAARHAARYKDVLAKSNDLYLEGGDAIKSGLELFDREWPNIRAGRDWAADHAGDDDHAAGLCSEYANAGAYCLHLRLHAHVRIQWLEAAAAAARGLGDRALEGNHLGNLGVAYANLGEPLRAIDYFEEHLANAQMNGDRRSVCGNLGNLGNAYADIGETGRAIELIEQQLQIARDIGHQRSEGIALGNLGNVYIQLGKPRRAIDFYEQQLVVTREIGDRRSEGNALWNMSLAQSQLGDRPSAMANAQAALELREQIEDPLAEMVRTQLAEWRGEA